jgi:hypothetical protein
MTEFGIFITGMNFKQYRLQLPVRHIINAGCSFGAEDLDDRDR